MILWYYTFIGRGRLAVFKAEEGEYDLNTALERVHTPDGFYPHEASDSVWVVPGTWPEE